MKIAIFSDIHGNREALKAILDDIKNENIDEVICLGDIIGIGPNPKECMDMIINSNIKMILGNHELYFLNSSKINHNTDTFKHHAWVKNQITLEQQEYLKKCNLIIEKTINNKRILFEHFLIDYNDKSMIPFYDFKILKDGSINKIVEELNYDLIFIGHEHTSFSINNKLYDVGSSGCVKNNFTKYTILDTDTFNIDVRSIEYNRKQFEEDVLKNDYPDRELIAPSFFGVEIK